VGGVAPKPTAASASTGRRADLQSVLYRAAAMVRTNEAALEEAGRKRHHVEEALVRA